MPINPGRKVTANKKLASKVIMILLKIKDNNLKIIGIHKQLYYRDYNDKVWPDVKVPGGNKTIQSAEKVRTTATTSSKLRLNHSFEAKLWNGRKD